MNLEQAGEVSAVIKSVKQSLHQRLERGARLRLEMRNRIQAGDEPIDMPRYLWLRRSSVDLIAFLADLAKNFNDSSDNDRVSVQDMRDVVDYVLMLLNEADK